MFNNLLLVDANTTMGRFIAHSLSAEGYDVRTVDSVHSALQCAPSLQPNLVIINSVGPASIRPERVLETAWSTPFICLADSHMGITQPPAAGEWLTTPFSFQDLLLLVQDVLFQRTLSGRRLFQLSSDLFVHIESILDTLRADLRARCVILSTSAGRLIKTAGSVEQGEALSLAALMSAGFSATAQAAQRLGHGDMFDSSLQESEGYGLHAIRLHGKLILSVAFSDSITVGMVRHYTAQAAVDILELLAQVVYRDDDVETIELDEGFRVTVNQTLDDILHE